jgi:hypothetical protein
MTTWKPRQPGRTALRAGGWLLIATACGPTREPEAAPVAEGLPPYTAAEATLFDDTLDPEIFGAELSGMEAGGDTKLAERTRRADSVVAVRVATVTREGGRSEGAAYELSLVPVGPPLSGAPVEGTLTVTIRAKSPSFPLVRRADTAFTGAQLILFFKRYNQQGQAVAHWHGKPDNEAVRVAVERARLLSDVGY